MKFSPGCTCCATSSCNRQICVNASGPCTVKIVGAAVTVTQGGTTYAGTTDATGKFCTPTGIASGTWTVVVDPTGTPFFSCLTPSSSQTSTTTFTSTDCTVHNANFAWSQNSSCCCSECGGGFTGFPVTSELIVGSPALSFSDTILGGCTLSLISSCTWQGTISYGVTACAPCPAATVPLTVNVSYGGGVWGLAISYPQASVGGNACPQPGGTPNSLIAIAPPTTCSLNPIDLTFVWGPFPNQIDCAGVTHTSTVTGP